VVGMAEAARLQDGKSPWGDRCSTRMGRVSGPTVIPPSGILSSEGSSPASPGRLSGPYRFNCRTISFSFSLSVRRCSSLRGIGNLLVNAPSNTLTTSSSSDQRGYCSSTNRKFSSQASFSSG